MAKKKVECLECGAMLNVINSMHLKKHNLTIPIYLYKFKGAYIVAPFECGECGKDVEDARSSRAKYCNKCSVIVKKRQVLEAVKRNQEKNRQRKRDYFINSLVGANREFAQSKEGNTVSSADLIEKYNGATRVDPTHTAWDYIPGVMDVKGTFHEGELAVNKDGRVKAWMKLKAEMDKLKKR